MVKVDRYRVVARFARLFPDPAVFEDQDHLVERYLVQNGLLPEKTFDLYQGVWKKQRIGEMAFQIRDFAHEIRTLNVTNVSELYEIMKKQSQTTSLSSIELAKMPEEAFQVTVAYLKSQLRKSAGEDALEVEVYAAKDLSASEKSSLEKRLTKESTGSTVYVIISKPSPLMKVETQ